jgi:hypothetical protein
MDFVLSTCFDQIDSVVLNVLCLSDSVHYSSS